MMRFTLVLSLVAFCVLADELGTKPLNIEKTEDPKEKSYRQFVGEQEFHLPFKTRLSESFKEGQTVHASGRISKDPQRIDFNFHKGAAKDADIPLHLSIRFDEGIFSGKIVYNIMKARFTSKASQPSNGNWSENEQRIDSPFKSEGLFDLRVRIVGGKFKVYANRREIGTFEQRENLGAWTTCRSAATSPLCAFSTTGGAEGIETLQIDGNVDLHTVTINDTPQ
ncbi:Galectin [Aphelenchoides fujianensis]|nr:Galectin [Aphelenchoides fujianensis]